MRLKSELWVKAYIRRVQGEGAPAVIVRRGDSDAGVILIKIARLDGTASLFGPAPAGMAETSEERRWVVLADGAAESDVDERIRRETSFDHDAWVVEVEDRQGRHYLESWLAKTDN